MSAYLLSAAKLVAAVNCTAQNADRYVEPINITIERYHIDTPERIAAWLAQVAHESARFAHVVENLNYSASGLALTWPSRYRGNDGKPNALALRLHRNPAAIANNVYAGRLGNGDERSGDGWRYRGRGLIQITGRYHYAAVSRSLGINAIAQPEVLTTELYAALSAGWYWDRSNLNALADVGDMQALTRCINGGLHGLASRVDMYDRSLQALT